MKKRLLITMTALMLVTITMMAVPAKPGAKKKVTLKDGTTVELSLKGDEHFSFYVDAAGVPCKLRNGELVQLTKDEVAEQWTAQKQKRQAISNTTNRRANRVGEAGITTGTQNGLVILLQYQDVKFQNDSLTTNSIYKRFFNEEGYKENGNEGSVRDYFMKQSYEQLTINFDVVGPYTTSRKMEYYGAQYTDESGNIHHDTYPATMVREGVDAAEKDGVDFSKYDWNNDGNVDQVFVIYAGYAQAQGADENTIWPHEWVLAGEGKSVKYDNVWINTYGCASELMDNSGSVMDGIGTACHEFTHCLGLPDMYDTAGNNYGMAYWDVMCAGSYNDDSRSPAGYTAYERWFSGWMEPTELKELTRINDMKPLMEQPEAYVLYNEKNRNEYYMLENRQPVSFDKGLDGHGLLIYHVDYSQSAWAQNTVNTVANHQRMVIVAADDDYNDYSPKSRAGDIWPGTTGNTILGNQTTPAAILYNANIDGSKLLNKQVDNIKETPTDVSGVNTISFVACRPEVPVPAADEATEQVEDNSVTISWPNVEGAVGYEVEWTTKDKAPKTPEEALRYEFTFEKFKSSSSSFTDISSKLSTYDNRFKGWKGEKLYTSPKMLQIGTTNAAGYLQTPTSGTLEVPSSSNMTVAIGAESGADGGVSGVVDFMYASSGDEYWTPDPNSKTFEVVDKDTVLLYYNDVRADFFNLKISPEKRMYINCLKIYDGIWTAEQLGFKTAAAQVSRRAVSTDIYPTTTNSITMPVDVSKLYFYRIRSVGEEGVYSGWSNEKTFDLEPTGIQSISMKVESDNNVRYFDLQGREVGPATKGLLIRKQGNEVKKVIK